MKFKPRPMSEVLATTREEIEWVWEPFIPRGTLVLLSAYMKVGKSTFAYALMRAIARGDRFCGYPTFKTGVLLLAVEERVRDVASRLERFGANALDPIYAHVAPLSPTISNLDDIRTFTLTNRIGVIFLDTLSMYWEVENENDNAEVRKAVVPLLELAHGSGLAVVLVHHNNKAEAEGGKGIRGASALFGMCDQGIIMKPNGNLDNGQRKLQCFGRFEETPGEVIVKLQDDDTWVEMTRGASSLDIVRESIRKALGGATSPGALSLASGAVSGTGGAPGASWLATGASLTASQIAEGLGLPVRKVQKALSPPPMWLIREGEGTKEKPYTYKKS